MASSSSSPPSAFTLLNIQQLISMVENSSIYQQTTYQDQIKVYQGMQNVTGQATTMLNNMQNDITALQSAFTTSPLSISSSSSSVVSASIINPAVVAPSSHTIAVTQLAQSQVYDSTGTGAFTSQTTGLNLTGGLTFTNSSTGANFTVSVASGDSLQSIRNNINSQASNFGVTASILTTTASGGGTQYQLVLTSSQTGAANAFTVNDSTNTFNFTQPTGGAAQDAIFTLDGGLTPIDRSTNSITDVLDGISFSLLQSGQSATLTVSSSTQGLVSGVQTAITNVINDYNAILNFVDKSVADNGTGAHYTPATGATPGGVGDDALGDNTLSMIKQALQNAMNNASGTGSITSLLQLGFTPSPTSAQTSKYAQTYYPTGQLTPNTSTLAQVLSTNFSDVQSFLTNTTNGLVTELNNALTTSLNGVPGSTTNTGILANENTMIGNQITNVQNELNLLNLSITSTTDSLNKRFSAINATLSQLSYTSQMLTAQFNSITSGG